MTTFYIIRHGNTEFNNKGRLQGGQIDSPLTEMGYNDAYNIAKKLNKMKFDAIFSSDLGRTFITAHIIADKLGLTNKIFRVKELREIDFGDLSGEFKDKAGIEYKKVKKDPKYRAPNGESYSDVKKRVMNKLFSLVNKKNENILIVTHAGCIRGIISEALNLKLDSLLKKPISHRFIAKMEVKNKKILNFKILNES